MDRVTETSPEPRKEWSTPELKEIDIEQITALSGATTKDGTGGAKS